MSLVREPFETKKQLVESGMDEKQAETLVEILAAAEYRTASKADLKETEERILKALEIQSKEFKSDLALTAKDFNLRLMAMTISIVVTLSAVSGFINWLVS